ncbi:MAG: polyketide cyclase [Bacteroidetes bacterium GWC2_33_15]|nr:MAG: polyketide cyclase [Bacteroidetes bacterium GWA2_33_15]OFX51573.1 MAG: polyketide cyclase [Bacteroidetes bacterium GWC2_33_15]OFX63358.1 MAG: polyketide cyclase [Bacteroidetes bacterium GWB2_32_14]OFX68043.1 MAG: polyketide cyclase [Bacteroidetes bacterium GWD2_33_33]HAN17137.1 polyketide cyclase [Bacteroidales bacterium]
MESNSKTIISIQEIINAPIELVWKYWTTPNDIIQWNNASDDWRTSRADNDLRVAGKFLYRMEAKDGSAGFDFAGEYNIVSKNKLIEYTMSDGRKVRVTFSKNENETLIVETFEAESENSIELQRAGWKAILSNFKRYVETKK